MPSVLAQRRKSWAMPAPEPTLPPTHLLQAAPTTGVGEGVPHALRCDVVQHPPASWSARSPPRAPWSCAWQPLAEVRSYFEVGRRAPHAHVAHVKLRVKHGNVPCARSGLANTTLTIDIGSTSTPAKPPRKSKFIHSALERAPINIWQSHHGGATAPYRMHAWHACLSSMSCIFHTPVPHPADLMALAWCHQSRPTRHRRESKPV